MLESLKLVCKNTAKNLNPIKMRHLFAYFNHPPYGRNYSAPLAMRGSALNLLKLFVPYSSEFLFSKDILTSSALRLHMECIYQAYIPQYSMVLYP
jgi:hypothetical protein